MPLYRVQYLPSTPLISCTPSVGFTEEAEPYVQLQLLPPKFSFSLTAFEQSRLSETSYKPLDLLGAGELV